MEIIFDLQVKEYSGGFASNIMVDSKSYFTELLG
jgi:hypothetical protein